MVVIVGSTGSEHRANAAVLPVEACMARLGRARAGVLTYSDRALPTLVPVTMRVVGGQVVLHLPDSRLAELLAGQLVALGIGRPRRLVLGAWRVVARGVLLDVPGDQLSLVLDPQQLEGTVWRSPLLALLP
jgi:hypothetical protein